MCQCLRTSVRFFLYLLNGLLIIISLNLLAISIYMVTLLLLNDIPDSRTIYLLAMLLSMGVLLFILPILGCVAIYKQKRCLVFVYVILLIIKAAILSSVALATFILVTEKDDPQSIRSIQEAFLKYNESGTIKVEIDILQENLKCCGIDGAKSWNGSIPESCCEQMPCDYEKSYKKGCRTLILNNRINFQSNLAKLFGISAFVIIGVAALSVWSMNKKANIDID